MNRYTYCVSIIALVTAWLLNACGSLHTSQTPEAVHAAWIQALRENNRQALLDLAADSDARTTTVDADLQRMQSYITQGYRGSGVDGGAFQGVDVLALTEAGQGKTGWSRWRFASVQICYAASLTPTMNGWKVVGWGQRLNCPSA